MSDDENKELNDGADTSGIFKGFNMKSSREIRAEQSSYAETPKVIQWTMKYSGGLIKNKNQAQYALLGFVALAIIISLFLFFGAIHSPLPPPADQIINVAGPKGER